MNDNAPKIPNINQFLPLFSGTFKPLKRKQASTPFFEKWIIVGQEGDLFTKVRLWIYEPTLEYPVISVFLQLKNASGSCFTKLTADDLQTLSENLSAWSTDIKNLLPQLESKKTAVNAYIDQYNAFSELAQEQIRNGMQSEPENAEEPPTYRQRDNHGRFK